MNNKSVQLWRQRIEDRKNSGQKVDDWCIANDISKHTYYYWRRKIKALDAESETSSPIFAEVTIDKYLPETAKPITPKLSISWKEFTIRITDSDSLPMAVELLKRLEQLC